MLLLFVFVFVIKQIMINYLSKAAKQ